MKKNIQEDESEDLNLIMSSEMNGAIMAIFKKSCCYYHFLHDFASMKLKEDGSVSVPIFRNDQIEEYRERYLKKFEKTLNDSFVFEEQSKIKKSVKNTGSNFSHTEETGWFCPRRFFDRILKNNNVRDTEYILYCK